MYAGRAQTGLPPYIVIFTVTPHPPGQDRDVRRARSHGLAGVHPDLDGQRRGRSRRALWSILAPIRRAMLPPACGRTDTEAVWDFTGHSQQKSTQPRLAMPDTPTRAAPLTGDRPRVRRSG